MAYTKQRAGIILVGPLADRPAASTGEYWYFATDEDGGTLYHSDGSTWTAITGGMTMPPSGSAGGALDGTYPNPGLAAGVAGAGLAETSDVLSVNVDGSTIEISSDTLQLKDGGVTSAKIANGTIVDADINASAAIAYSKLALSASIVSGDIVNGTIVDADVNAAAAIAYSKLALGTSIVQGDLATALLTALAGQANPWTVIRKSSDTSRNATTTVAADPALAFTATNATVYEWQAFILYVSASGGGTPDLKVAFAEDATARGAARSVGLNTGDSAATATLTTQTGSTAAWGTATTVRAFEATGWHVGAGGTFALYWAQNTSSGSPNDTTVLTGSILRYRVVS